MILVRKTELGAELIEEFRRNSMEIVLSPRNKDEAVVYLQRQLLHQRFLLRQDGTECFTVERAINHADMLSRQKPTIRKQYVLEEAEAMIAGNERENAERLATRESTSVSRTLR
jgi:hypothetical protein